MRVAIDFEAEGLLDGASDRDARLELLQSLEEEGFSARGAARSGRAGPPGAVAGRARAGRGGKALHARGARGGDRPRPRVPDEAARALGVPVREPGERAITEEELELSRNAKTLLDAGLDPEAFLELTAVMSRSMQNIAASLTSVFGEAFLQAGRHRARPRPSLRRGAPQPRSARRADAPAHAEPAPARADARGGGRARRSSRPGV